MVENDFYPDIIKGAACEGIVLYRMLDGGGVKVPFDMCGYLNGFDLSGNDSVWGCGIAIEVKVWRNKGHCSELPIKLFEPHQLEHLRLVAKTKNVSLALIVQLHAPKKYISIYSFNRNEWIGELRKTTDGWKGWSSMHISLLYPGAHLI